MTKLFILSHLEARKRAAQCIAESPDGYEVRIAAPKRNLDQNSKLHATLGEISAQMEWAGAKRSLECWKRLLTASWMRATGRNVQMLPALDGQGIDIVYAPTSELTRAEMAELIDFVDAWAAVQGIALAA